VVADTVLPSGKVIVRTDDFRKEGLRQAGVLGLELVALDFEGANRCLQEGRIETWCSYPR
jgi:hypothetical protein